MHDHHDGEKGTTADERTDPPQADRGRLAHLIGHWIEHNDGHRRGYLEWRDKLEGEGLPRTYAALGHIADLTAEMNTHLRDALAELEEGS